MIVAAKNGHLNVVQFLCQSKEVLGLNVDVRGGWNAITALMKAAERQKPEEKCHKDVVEYLVEKANASAKLVNSVSFCYM